MKTLARHALLLCLFLFPMAGTTAFAQVDEATQLKRDARKNLVIKEWNTDPKSKTRWLDRVTVYDEQGRKIEEIEYTKVGQKWRETFEYGPNGRVVKNTVYDDRNKVVQVRKFEYNADGTKKKQFNYSPSGKLLTVKVFEYTTDKD
ncbi:MAG: hypothetical protein MJY84_04270 [Bacteroidales bacterium]|nr:hypothetical protein [Bacteroidales bacterium]